MKRTLTILLAVAVLLCGLGGSALAKASETVTLPVTGMKVTASYASGQYYTALLAELKNAAGVSPAQRFVNIALSQKGYKGSTSSSQLDGNGNEGIYTEFSNHRNVGGYDWCAAFVSWCAEAAGLSGSNVLPRSNYAGGKNAKGKAAWADPAGAGTVGTFHRIWSDDFSKLVDYRPQPGDLCLFMKDTNTWSGTSHVEIVVSSNSGKNSDGSYTFKTVGRNGNVVGVKTYKTSANRSSKKSVRKFKGFYTPNWGAASTWSASDVGGINAQQRDEYTAAPGKPSLRVAVGTGKTATTFSWDATAGTEYYTLRVYNSSGTQVLLQGGISGTSYSTQLAEGSYTAKLAAVNNTLGKWTFSDSAAFTVTASAKPGKPVLHVGGYYSDLNGCSETVFSWDATANTEYYTLRIYSAEPGYEDTLYRLRGGIKGTKFYAQLYTGDYYATLASVNNTEGVWTFSDKVYFSVKYLQPDALGTPVVSRVGSNKKYNVYEGKRSWMGVRETTIYARVPFAMITSQAEQDLVADAVSEFGKPCWLGGDAFQHEGAWYWFYDNVPFTYTNWAPGEPSGGYGIENCLVMLPNGQWIDHFGHFTDYSDSTDEDVYGFVLEFEPTSISVESAYDVFTAGAPLEREDLTVRVTFGDGETVEVYDYDLTQTGDAAGSQTVEVAWGSRKGSLAVTYIEDGAQSADLILPRKLKRVDDEAFMNATVGSVYCPDGLTTIGARAFSGCANLRRIFIPESVTQIDDTAFEGCTNLWILGARGSVAEAFASQHGLRFSVLR